MPNLSITLPLDAVEHLISIGHKIGHQHLKPRHKEALELVESKIVEVRKAAGVEAVSGSGAVAYLEGATLADNPYDQLYEAKLWREWHEAWQDIERHRR